jgi:hypothetical protein
MADPAPPRRRFQFRLRTLLIGVAIIAALCPLGVKYIHKLQKQRREAEDRAFLIETLKKQGRFQPGDGMIGP